MNITAKTKICMIIGDPVEHSLSPQMHNAAYEALDIDDQFVHVAAKVKAEDVGKTVGAMRILGFRGLTCTIPHKTTVMQYLDWIDDTAKKIGAVNSIVNDNGVIKGYNTDWIGVLKPLEKIVDLKNKNVVIIGAGGAARAMAYAVTIKGANLTVHNRTLEKANELANAFGGNAKSLDQLEEVQSADIILNATSIGMHPNEYESPVSKEYIKKHHIIFDAVYVPYETQLIKDAKEKGAKVIHGTEMLLHEAFAKFKLYTGYDAPEEIMRKTLMQNLLK